MKSVFILTICVLGCCLTATSQYTYFNQLDGPGVGNPETTGNLEIVGDSIYVFGGVGIDGTSYEYSRIYSSEGEVIDEALYYFGHLVYSGVSIAFQKIPNDNGFLFTHTQYESTEGEGLVMRISPNLDTLWTKTYNQYAPETSFYGHALSENGFILAGEHVVTDPVGRGTFIMEIDTEGEVLWHNEIHAPDEGLFRNVNISQFEEHFLVSGLDQAGENQSYIEILNSEGDLIASLQDDSPPPLGQAGRMLHIINSENEIIACQGVSYSWLQPPSLAYNAIRMYKLDMNMPELIQQGEYFEDENWLAGNVRKMIEVSDGYVLMGGYREPVDGVNQPKAWIMKIDDAFQEQWYTELSYDDAPGNTHYPYDMEQTSDGGYVVVGAYRNSADFYDRTWLVKVDACGDLEWQGCEPVGLDDPSTTLRGLRLEIYPNPAANRVRVGFPSLGGQGVQRGLSLQVLDISGKVVKEMSNSELRMLNDEVTIDVSDLPVGLYSVVLHTEEGDVFSNKLLIE